METTVIAGVSFAKTPFDEIATKVREIRDLGWTDLDRGDPWVISFEKRVPDSDQADAELQRVMGDYWLDADAIRALLASR